MGSSPFERAFKAAAVIAGAVFCEDGSNIMELGFILTSLNCSAVMNLCSSLQIIIGFSAFAKFLILCVVICKNEEFFLLLIDKYCFGKLLLERGQSLVPVPPQRTIGSILSFLSKKFLCKLFFRDDLNIL